MKNFCTCVVLLACLAASSWLPAQQKAADPIKPVLLVIDIQNDYLPIMDAAEAKPAMAAIPDAINLFHTLGYPVIHVYHTDAQRGPQPGTEGFEFPKTIPITGTDAKVVKHFPSAFKETDLEKVIREKGGNTLYLCGLSMTGCVLATYQSALGLGYRAFIIDGFVMSHDAAKTKAYQAKCQSVTFTELKAQLDSLPQ